MLGTALWFALACSVLAAVLLDGAAAFGRAGVQAAADRAVDGAVQDALAAYQNALGAAIARSAPPFTSPAPFAGATPSLDGYAAAIATLPRPFSSTEPATGAAGLRFTLAYAVTPTTLVAPSCTAQQQPDAADTIGWLQCDGFVQESRMSLHVVVTVLDADGAATFVQRDADATLRLFATPPYSALTGIDDAAATRTADGPGSAAHEGDLGGDTLSGASPQPSPSPWPSAGTLIHVRYACVDGAGSCANAAPPDPDAGLRANARWSNGNLPQP